MVVEVSQKTLVVQSNKLIEAKYRLSVEEQKIIKILIAQIRKNDEDFRDYEFRVKDLAEILGMEHSNTYGILRGITKRLLTRVLEFDNPENNTILQTTWLSSALYKKGEGTVTLRFDPQLKPLLLHLQSYFTKYELGQIMQFKGQYTIRFFELRKSFLGRNQKVMDFKLKDLWEMLGLRKDEYTLFKNFKNRVLEPARLELLEKTGQSFSWEPIKQGRGGRVVGVRFTFDGEDNAKIDEIVEVREQPKKEIRQLVLVTEAEEEPTPEGEAVAELVGVGVSPKTAQTLTEKHGPEYIQEKIELLSQKKDIKSSAGFVVSAIREDWRDEKVEKEKQAREERRKKEDEEIRKRELRRIKDKYEEFKKAIAFEQYQKLPESVREEWKNEFMKNQPFFARLLRKGFDFESGAFRAFVMQRLALPTFDNFMEKNGVQLNDDDKTLLSD